MGANKSMLGTHALNPGAESWHVPAGPGRWRTGSTGVQLLEATAFSFTADTRMFIDAAHTPLVCDNVHYSKSLGYAVIPIIMTSTTEEWRRGKRSRV